MSKEKSTIKRQSPMSEVLSYGLFFLGQNLIFMLVLSWLPYFYTDVALISPFTSSIIFLIAKVWDAINDPIFGVLLDKTKPKKGKFTPWIKASSFLLPLSTLLIFSIPADMATWLKVTLAFVTYAVWDILYTLSDAPAFALATVMTDNIEERTKLVQFNRIGANIGIYGTMLLVPLVVERAGMFKTVLVFCIIALVTMIPLGFVAKERVVAKKTDVVEEHTLKEMFQYIGKNKYIMLLFSSMIIGNIFKVALNTYISDHIFGSLDVLAMSTLVALPGVFLAYALIPTINKFLDKITIYKLALFGSMIFGAIIYFAGYGNITVYYILNAIKTFIEAFSGALLLTFTADTLEYGQYKTGMRKEGVAFSLQTFAAKFMTALSTVLTTVVLGVIGYSPKVAMTATMSKYMWAANWFLPIIGILLSLPLILRYNLGDKDVQIFADINAGRIERTEGEKLLSREY